VNAHVNIVGMSNIDMFQTIRTRLELKVSFYIRENMSFLKCEGIDKIKSLQRLKTFLNLKIFADTKNVFIPRLPF